MTANKWPFKRKKWTGNNFFNVVAPADNPCGVATAYPTQQTMVHQGGYVNQFSQPQQAVGGMYFFKFDTIYY